MLILSESMCLGSVPKVLLMSNVVNNYILHASVAAFRPLTIV